VARPRDHGMVTAELAMAVPVVVAVLAVALSAVSLGIDEVRCVDAARLAARALARGDSEAAARSAAVAAAPAGAAVVLGVAGSDVSVSVSASRDLAGWSVFNVRGSASAAREHAGLEGP
jgi:hypothetical protein